MAERQRGRDPNKGQHKQFVEGEPPIYHLAARYPDEQTSEETYDAARQLVADEPCSLSTYRMLLQPGDIWHVAVLGAPPEPELLRRVESIVLAQGEQVVLPDYVLQALLIRRAEQAQKGQWVEHRSPRRPTR